MATIGAADQRFAGLWREGLLLESFITGLGRTSYCMHTHRHWLWLAIGTAAALAMASASAAGLGAGASSAVLGQPLDFAVQVRLEPGDTLTAECVSAEVTAGDRRLPPAAVRAVLDMTGPETARVRVQTQSAIDEPVIGIQLSVGCLARMTRRYVVLADPPQIAGLAAVATAPAFAANPTPVSDAPSGAPATTSAPASLDATSANPARSTGAPSASTGNAAAAAATATAPSPRVRAERRAAATPTAARPRAPRRGAVRVAANAAARPDAPARLMLEPAEAPRSTESAAVDEALAAVAQAASAARAAASAASASAERMATLERTVEQLRTEAKTNRDLALQFRQRLSETEGASAWMLPLMAVAGLLAALAAWLAWRLGRVQSARQQGWRDASVAEAAVVPTQDLAPSRHPTAPIPFVTSELQRPSAHPANRARSAPAWPPPAPPVAWPPPDSTITPEPTAAPAEAPFEIDSAMQRTEPLPPSALPNAFAGATPDGGAPRDVSIEELIDLEQQAEFFVVLGQDDAAIDLLAEHLRSTGGGSPLPYLKLLEIHHRRDEREAYERIRGRFNHRFNAYAPEWGVDLGHGRSLDDYSGVIPRLQQVWARPLDAMAELEALLFRKSRGDLFDLPAYREVLFLYSLARDLMDRASADTGNVDLLLPIADGGEFSSTAPAPFLGLERDAFRDTMPPDDRPTGPVDFDVSAAERPTSIFDLLEEKTLPLRRP